MNPPPPRESFRLGRWTLRFPLYLAPMAGVTDRPFRQLCKELGADVMVTEFVSAEGIFRRNARTVEYLAFDPAERPLGIQLFGADPDHLAAAARLATEWKQPDFIDLNFGCPVNKVVAKNGGAAILRDLPLLGRIARAVVTATAPVPVTAKIRLGWSREQINAPEAATILEAAGVAALAVHGRTRDQGYGGRADWGMIARVAATVAIPVIGNGDIDSAATALHRRATAGVAGLMIGREAMVNPWIFREIKAALAGAPPSRPASYEDRRAFVLRLARLAIQETPDEQRAIRRLRTRLMALTRRLPGARDLRERLGTAASVADLENLPWPGMAAGPTGEMGSAEPPPDRNRTTR